MEKSASRSGFEGAGFPHKVVVHGGMTVHHGKRLAVLGSSSMVSWQKPATSQSVCLHNGNPRGGKETAFYSVYMNNDLNEVCSELCASFCSKAYIAATAAG